MGWREGLGLRQKAKDRSLCKDLPHQVPRAGQREVGTASSVRALGDREVTEVLFTGTPMWEDGVNF